jgi:hypothetical protein
VDQEKGHVYFSFTTLLVKTDLAGALVGTVGGISGHLGDVVFDPRRRKIYGSLEYKGAGAFYIAVFDADAIDRPGLTAADGGLVRTVYLPEVVRDYTAVVADAGRFGGDRAVSRDHRYGCSGVDGVSLGPPFGMPNGAWQLTVAYGVHSDVERSDNDHQVLLQYPVDRLLRFAEVLDEAAPHRNGPPTPGGKFFVRTGNTRFGVQNLEYDEWTGRWFLGVYAGEKPRFPNFTLFAVDAGARPAFAPLAGLGGEHGAQLELAADGLLDVATGVRGWRQRADVGLESLGNGLFYVSADSSLAGMQSSDLALCRWTGDADQPFQPVRAREVRRHAIGRLRPPIARLTASNR